MKLLPRKLINRQGVIETRSHIYLQKGQALILLLLILSVVLVVSLSIASRSITDIGTVVYEEEAQRAFSAAEAGIEEVLNNPISGGFSATFDNNTNVSAIIPAPSVSEGYIYPDRLYSGNSALFWLSSKDNATGQFKCTTDGAFPCVVQPLRVKYCWGANDTNQSPSVVISTYYDTSLNSVNSNNYNNVSVHRMAFSSSSTASDNFTVVGTQNVNQRTLGGQIFHRCVTVNFNTGGTQNPNVGSVGGMGSCPNPGCILLTSVQLLHTAGVPPIPEPVGILAIGQTSPHSLPEQGLRIDSTGTAGETQRRVDVLRTHTMPPSMFSSAVFSMTDIDK
jgi:hypothetical protein